MSNIISLADRRKKTHVAGETDMRPRITRIIHRKSPEEAFLMGVIGPTAERLGTVDIFAYDEPEPPRYA